ncbi:Uncharacterised protein [Serratia rubidaea]|uniref:Uncharacterized protein n=1 Tax=Serratia rubidaea TaxID=61652 RepID=A0A4U9HNJ6_SERRU|nr:Uncharacterised protein [Serratia rubidaea]
MLNSVMVFAPQRAFDVRTDIFYYRVIQGIIAALAQHEVRSATARWKRRTATGRCSSAR